MYSDQEIQERQLWRQRLRSIKKEFSLVDETFPTMQIGDLVVNPDHPDGEIRKYASAFLGKNWQEISPMVWCREDGFLFFATEKAFAYFLPSVLCCDYKSRLDSRISLGNTWDALTFCLTAGYRDVDQFTEALNRKEKEYNIDRICKVLSQYNSTQLDILRTWCRDMEERSGEFIEIEHMENLMILRLIDYMQATKYD